MSEVRRTTSESQYTESRTSEALAFRVPRFGLASGNGFSGSEQTPPERGACDLACCPQTIASRFALSIRRQIARTSKWRNQVQSTARSVAVPAALVVEERAETASAFSPATVF